MVCFIFSFFHSACNSSLEFEKYKLQKAMKFSDLDSCWKFFWIKTGILVLIYSSTFLFSILLLVTFYIIKRTIYITCTCKLRQLLFDVLLYRVYVWFSISQRHSSVISNYIINYIIYLLVVPAFNLHKPFVNNGIDLFKTNISVI